MSNDPSDPIAVLGASTARRGFAVGAQIILGLMLIYLGLSNEGALWAQIALMLLGGLSIWSSMRLWQSTGRRLILTEEGLSDDTGRWIARMDDIAEVERSPFAIKPSNGFALVMRSPGPRTWEPGMWWQWGRRIAVGGVTPAADGKFMADMIKMRLMERNGQI